jgi:hypothetical protein
MLCNFNNINQTKFTELTCSQIHPKSWSQDQECAGHSEETSQHLHLQTQLKCSQYESLIDHHVSSTQEAKYYEIYIDQQYRANSRQ